ncbi:hypothetical protein [Shinella sp.]|uniref:hypothetical protein n=1 Tax=Shinella sp. TaxID=1870904 RepID=UPI0039E4226E
MRAPPLDILERVTRRMAMRLLVAIIVLAPTTLRADDVPDTQQLIAEWIEHNTLCRGLHGDDPRMQPACDERQRIGRALDKLGWCYGETNQMAYQMQWHRCHDNSLHAE